MTFAGTVSFTVWMVGANGLGGFTELTCSRFRWPSVPGKALLRGIPLSGGRSGIFGVWLLPAPPREEKKIAAPFRPGDNALEIRPSRGPGTRR